MRAGVPLFTWPMCYDKAMSGLALFWKEYSLAVRTHLLCFVHTIRITLSRIQEDKGISQEAFKALFPAFNVTILITYCGV